MGVPEKGWIVVTPVYSPERSRAILVRRGWVPDSWRQAQSWKTATINDGGVGVVSGGEIGNSFVPENKPEAGEWFTLNAAEMVCPARVHARHSSFVACCIESGSAVHAHSYSH